MEFEKTTVIDDGSSVLESIPLGAAIDQYRTMLMHRYPSELCKLFSQHNASAMRHAPEGCGATLLYANILSIFRDYDVRVLDTRINPDEVVMTLRIWMTFLEGAGKDKVHAMSRLGFREKHQEILSSHYDLVIFDTAVELTAETMEVAVFDAFVKAWRILKTGGIMSFEGIPPTCVHWLMSTLSSLYLWARRDFEVRILQKSSDAQVTVLIRKNTWEPLRAPLVKPALPSPSLTDNVLVVVTSSVKSIGNNNVFSEAARFRQVIESIRTVRMRIPNAYVVIAEINQLNEGQQSVLRDEGVRSLFTFTDLVGVQKSIAECEMLRRIFDAHAHGEFLAFVKLSGRYVLLDNFIPYDPSRITCKRMRNKEIMTRFFSIPRAYFPHFRAGLDEIVQFDLFMENKMDIEHAFGKFLPDMNEAAKGFPCLGVGGCIAATCTLVYE
jgi:hypothetical protein